MEGKNELETIGIILSITRLIVNTIVHIIEHRNSTLHDTTIINLTHQASTPKLKNPKTVEELIKEPSVNSDKKKLTNLFKDFETVE